MPVKLPKSNTQFNLYTNSDLAVVSQGIHDGLLASIATFPTPPVLPAALQTLITAYIAAMTAAVDGSKLDTANLRAAKFVLINALRQDSAYVNYIIYQQISTGTDYATAQTLILATGYALSKDPTPAGILPSPDVKKSGSFEKGQFNIQLIKVPGAKAYEILLTDLNTGIAQTFVFPNTRITFFNLISSHNYSARMYSIGASPDRTFSTTITQIII